MDLPSFSDDPCYNWIGCKLHKIRHFPGCTVQCNATQWKSKEMVANVINVLLNYLKGLI